MDLKRAIKERRSVRVFSSRSPDWRKIIECVDSMLYLPLAGNVPIHKFILISDLNKIQKIAQLCQQEFVADTEYVVVICSNIKKLEKMYEQDAYKYAKQESGAAIQNFLLMLTAYGLSTCWIGLFDEKELKRLLKIPDDTTVEALFPIGYEGKKTRSIRKQDLDVNLFFDEWGNRYMK
ncbi:nitroreductase family protein [Candidatus Pacearchaeota archaeon]|nr:nitroreductase family protein [Candidatus Pacearchaeota archaeon]